MTMNEQLKKSLTDLIDETLLELEELRKSRFAAAEIKIEGPGEGIDGKPSDGELSAKAEEKDEKAEEKEEKEEKAEDKKDDVEKAEDKKEDDPADSDKTKRDLKDLMGKKEEKEEKEEDEEEDEEKEEKSSKADMKKSFEESETLMKSYVEERVKPLEDKLSTILDLVNKIAEQPVAPKGISIKAAPLMKSTEAQETESLSKAQVASKLFELKKSGTSVDTLDITKADLGQDLENIVKKYKLS